jgi:hypothetical protein
MGWLGLVGVIEIGIAIEIEKMRDFRTLSFAQIL